MQNYFTTRNDAASHLDGYESWEYGDAANFSDFCDYAYDHQELYTSYDDVDGYSFDGAQAMRDYLTSVGESPADYSL